MHAASLGFGHAGAVADAVQAAGLAASVFFSSTALFTHLAAASKAVRLDAEARVRALPGEWTILRPTMIYGAAGDRNMERLDPFLARSPVVPLPGGRTGPGPAGSRRRPRPRRGGRAACPDAARREYNLSGAEPGPAARTGGAHRGPARPAAAARVRARAPRRSGAARLGAPRAAPAAQAGAGAAAGRRTRPSPTTRPVATGATRLGAGARGSLKRSRRSVRRRSGSPSFQPFRTGARAARRASWGASTWARKSPARS